MNIMQEFFVTLKQIVDEFSLEIVYNDIDLEKAKVTTADVNRPGLQMVDFFDYFDPKRIQIMGNVEFSFLDTMNTEDRSHCIQSLFKKKIPVLVVSRGQEVFEEFLSAAKIYHIPIFRAKQETSRFMAMLIAFLSVQLAPRITIHGVLCEVYGEGVLITGESGVGKSETAIELVKRGHRLVADDAVEVKRVSERTLVGTSPETIRHFIELRGIGIVDVRRIFGMGSIKETEKIDLIINLENWNKEKQYDRLGLVTDYSELLEVSVPTLTIPVKPGRNLAVVIEVASMNNRQKKLGHNAAEELNNRIISKMNNELENR
jgi:HPr kinase/phosphorylase